MMLRSRRVLGVVASSALAFSFMQVAACGWTPEEGGIVLPPAPVPVVDTKVAGLFVDAKTGAPVLSDVTVTLRDEAGRLLNNTRDGSGKAKSTFTVKQGVLAFAVEKPYFPMVVVVVAEADGYIGASAKVRLTQAGTSSFEVNLPNISSPPAGTAVAVQQIGTADASGRLTAAASLSTPAESTSGGTASVSIPAGTVIRTASGEALTGALTATAMYFNNSADTSLEAFPGGFGLREDLALVTGGFSAVVIRDAAGRVASTFSQEFEVAITVPGTTRNPKTGEQVRAGESLSFYSYSETAGVWKTEGATTLEAGTGGNFIARKMVNHLSYFSTAWEQAACGTSRNIVVKGGDNTPLTVKVVRDGGGYSAGAALSGGKATVGRALRGASAKAKAFVGSREVGAVQIGDLCATGDVTLDVNVPASSPASLKVGVTETCRGDTIARPVQGASTFALVNGALNGVFTNSDGLATYSGLASGLDVVVLAENRRANKFFEARTVTLNAGENSTQFDASIDCGQATGGGTGGGTGSGTGAGP
jgi:hypothetical protein